jgi:hypothetical protein
VPQEVVSPFCGAARSSIAAAASARRPRADARGRPARARRPPATRRARRTRACFPETPSGAGDPAPLVGPGIRRILSRPITPAR